MKKIFLTVAVAAFVAVGFTSCNKMECIECNGEVTMCEEDYDAADYGGVPWSSWKLSATASPDCKVVKQ